MSQRIFQACEDFYKDVEISNEIDLATKLRELRDDPHILEAILIKSDLEITDHRTAREYCQEKVRREALIEESSYLNILMFSFVDYIFFKWKVSIFF